MDKKKKQQQRRQSLTPEEQIAISKRAKRRFRALIRTVIRNLYWLEDVEDQELGQDVQKNILLLTRKKEKKSLLTLQDKAILNKPTQHRTEIEKHHLNRVIGGLKCFRRYPSHVKSQLAGVTYFVYYEPGRVVVRQGDEAHALYFVITGDVTVSQESFDPVLNEMVKQDIATMGPGSMFGEVSLLHNIKRTATITTNTHCELLCLRKNDFDVVLKGTVQQQWDDVQNAMSQFSYFDGWDEIAIRECCILSKMKVYLTDQTVLGDGQGLRDFVYFILKGKCRVIEHLLVTYTVRNGKKIYKLYVPPPNTGTELHETSQEVSVSPHHSKVAVLKRSTSDTRQLKHEASKRPVEWENDKKSVDGNADLKHLENTSPHDSVSPLSKSDKKSKQDLIPDDIPEPTASTVLNLSLKPAPRMSDATVPPNVETHFMQVCFLNPTACFGIGENMKHRRIVAVTYTECLLIPRYWLLQRNKGNIWNRVQQYLNNHIPSTEQVFKEFINQRKWKAHRQKMVKEILANRKLANDNTLTNVPYFIRINEEIDLD